MSSTQVSRSLQGTQPHATGKQFDLLTTCLTFDASENIVDVAELACRTSFQPDSQLSGGLHAGSDPAGCVSTPGTRRIHLRTPNGASTQFEFDSVLGHSSSQEEVFDSECHPQHKLSGHPSVLIVLCDLYQTGGDS